MNGACILIGVMFILNVVNILIYDLDRKSLIIVNNSLKSIPKMRMDVRTDTHTLAHTDTLSGELCYLH